MDNQESATPQPKADQPLAGATAPQPPKTSFLLPALLGLLVLLLGSTIFLAYQNMQLQKQIAQSVKPYAPTPSPTPTPDPTTAWKTYANASLGISFRYPSNSIKKMDTLNTNGALEFNSFILLVEKSSDSLTNYVNKLKDSNSVVPLTKTVGNMPTIEWIGSYKNAPTQYVSFENKGYVYGFGITPLDDMTNFNPNNTNLLTQILSTFKFTDLQNATCKSVNLNVSAVFPNQNWTCKIDNFGKEQAGRDGTMTLTSPIFTVNITSLGRGAFCDVSDPNPQSPRYDPTHACTVSDFYSNNGILLKVYKLNGIRKEIFGQINGGPSVSITFLSMDNREMTSAEKSEIMSLLDSIIFTK